MKKIVDSLPQDSICILGIPHDENSSFLKGPAKAPESIRSSYFSNSANLWSETGLDLGAATHLYDLGNLDFSSSGNDFTHITSSVKKILASKNRLICLGGDHAITFPVIEAYAHYHDNLNILHLDAHPDLYDSLDGNSFSHACPFARIMESKLAVRLVQAGIRTVTGHQKAQADKFDVEIHEMKDGFNTIGALAFDGPVYVSLDMDCLDPAFAPGVSHPEPGGMSTRQILDIVQNVTGKIIGADIVEYNPDRDLNRITSMTAAKILKEIIARIHRDNDWPGG